MADGKGLPWQVITGAQIRQARAALRLTRTQLFERSGVAVRTIRRAEFSVGESAITVAQVAAIQAALEAAGVEFTNGGQPGVNLKGEPRV